MADASPGLKTTQIYTDSRRMGRCRSCRALLVFAVVVKTGRRMPFDAPLEVLATGVERQQSVQTVDLARSHFATCPDAKKFRRPR